MTRFRSLLFVFAGLAFATFSKAQSIETHSFAYKGFQLTLHDIAPAPDGSLALVGEIYTDYDDPAQRDPKIDSALGENAGQYRGDYIGIALLTDPHLKPKSIELFPNLRPSAVAYHAADSSFWIGISHIRPDGWKTDDSRWQMGFLTLNPYTLRRKFFDVETPYPTILHSMAFEGNNLVVLARKNPSLLDKRAESSAVFTFSTTAFHKATRMPYTQTPNLLHTVFPPIDSTPCLILTPMHQHAGGYFFGASAGCIEPFVGFNLYRYANGKVDRHTPEMDRPDRFPFLTAYLPLRDGNFLLVYVPSSYDKDIMVEKVDAQLQSLWKQKLDDGPYPTSLQQVLEMPDGKIIVPYANAQKKWRYLVYDGQGNRLPDIDTELPESLYIFALRPRDAHSFFCLFSATHHSEADMVQMVHVN